MYAGQDEKYANIYYFISHKCDDEITTTVVDLNENIELGSFDVMGKFDSGETVDMGIRVNKEYQGNGFARRLVKTMCSYIIKHGYPRIRKDQLLFIDADASGGFWDEIGMKENRYGYDYGGIRNIEGVGYEKVITFGELCKWAKVPMT